MKTIIYLIVLIPSLLKSYSQQITPISKQEFDSATFNNLHFLKEELKDVKIVGLGESSHYMGKTYTAKVKLIKYLHENCGFDVIAFESPMYNLYKVNDTVTIGKYPKEDIFNHLSSVWYAKELDELFDYVVKTRKSNRPLICAGFDGRIFSNQENTLVVDYCNFIKKLNIESNSNIEIDSSFIKIMNTNVKNCFSEEKILPQDTLVLYHKFNEVKNSFKKIENKNDNNYYSFWNQMTENLEALYRTSYLNYNVRDKQMAKNVSFLATNLYKDKKIILWAATLHLHDKPELIEHKSKNLYKDEFMGQYLRTEFQERYYTIAFTPFSGIVGFKGYLGLGKRKVKSEEGSLEKFINDNYHCDYAYIPLRNIEVPKIITENKLNKSNIIGSRPFIMDLTKVVDAYFYIREEHLITWKNNKDEN
jgi:erythromycin esterase